MYRLSENAILREDEDGQYVEFAFLGGIGEGKSFLIDRQDYHLVSDTPSGIFMQDTGRGLFYVRRRCRGATGGQVGLARLILNVGRGEVVTYRDGDQMNLRRRNLSTQSGRAWRADATVVDHWTMAKTKFPDDDAGS